MTLFQASCIVGMRAARPSLRSRCSRAAKAELSPGPSERLAVPAIASPQQLPTLDGESWAAYNQYSQAYPNTPRTGCLRRPKPACCRSRAPFLTMLICNEARRNTRRDGSVLRRRTGERSPVPRLVRRRSMRIRRKRRIDGDPPKQRIGQVQRFVILGIGWNIGLRSRLLAPLRLEVSP